MLTSVLLATTGRPDAAECVVSEIRATTRPLRVEIVAAVDADSETRRRLGPKVEQLSYSDEYRGCSRAWNDALARATGELFVLAADDLRFKPGWLETALEEMSRFPDGWGMVGFNDGHWGPELSTHYLVHRRFVIEVLGGVIAWEHYKHSFNDVEINERARNSGRYTWCAHARVNHVHWLFGDRPQDGTDQRQLGLHPESERIFNERRAAGFPNDYEPVITA